MSMLWWKLRELKGKQFKTEFVLTADTYENLYIEPLKVGQLVNVVTTVDEEEGRQL